MENYQNYFIKDFKGGISSEGHRGPRGSFKYGENLNIRGQDNTLTCNQALKADSGAVVVDLVLAFVKGSDGNVYAFGDMGKIYRKSSGTWSEVYDEEVKITGAAQFKNNDGSDNYINYLYWATQTKLKRIKLSDAGGTWAGNVEEHGTFKRGSADFLHTMRVGVGVLMITDGEYLALTDYEGGFNNHALELSSGDVGKALLDRDDRIIIGAEGEALPEGWIFTWDRFADSWVTKRNAQGISVNGMAFLEGGVILQVGDEGKIRYYNLLESSPLKQIPETENTKPGAIVNYKTIPHIGMNGDKGGVYSLGRLDKNDPIALNLEYKVTGEIGALLADGDDLYVSWKNGANYGISITDDSNKAEATYQGLEFDAGQPQNDKIFNIIKIHTLPIPKDCEVKVYYKTTNETSWVETQLADGEDAITEGMVKGVYMIEGQGERYEVRVDLIPDGNNTPEVLSINTYFYQGEST